ncbi:MAG: DNA integrity scanning protein DisA nucleotide-binding domain protein [Bacteroidales bacterium]|nr:DNA integrity scanning protein DisA nucleotide-binding domain protein [Bacteroidales bacterium]
MFDFIEISVIDVLDILVVAFIIYQGFKIMRRTNAFNVFLIIVAYYILWSLSGALRMGLTNTLLGGLLEVGVITLLVIYQPELRRFMQQMGNKGNRYWRETRLGKALFGSTTSQGLGNEALDELMLACDAMAKSKTGALIVIKHSNSLEFVTRTGDVIDAIIKRRLIENLFFKNSPLHDGAVVIDEDKIIASRCTIPIIENPDIPAQFGLRHRAAVSITLDTDATVIVVSEETGSIHYVENGEMKPINSISELRLLVEESFRKESNSK